MAACMPLFVCCCDSDSRWLEILAIPDFVVQTYTSNYSFKAVLTAVIRTDTSSTA